MKADIQGGIDIAIKVPAHQYQQTIDFYRHDIGLPEITDKAPAVGFVLGPNRLWIDEAPALSQAEVWLELFTTDFPKTEKHLEQSGVVLISSNVDFTNMVTDDGSLSEDYELLYC